MENRNKHNLFRKILTTLVILLLLLVAAALIGTVIQLFIDDPLNTKITWQSIIDTLKSASSYGIIIIFWVVLICVYIYFSVKFGYFSASKLLNREDRAQSGLHGQARWQTPSEMAMNFGQKLTKRSYAPYAWNNLGKSDFEGYVCNSFKKDGKLYIEGVAKRQACVIGGTGSGKTTGFISPTIQANALSKKKSSLFIYDLKGDLYKMHSKLLTEQGYNVVIINLKEPIKSVKYNPLALIWDLYQEYLKAKKTVIKLSNDKNKEYQTALATMTDLDARISNYITDIAIKIVPTAVGENKIWSEGSQGIIKGLLWAMLEDSENKIFNMTKEKFTLSQLGNILNIPSQREELFNFLQDREKDSMVFKKVGSILNNDSEKTVSSYISNTQTNLEKFTEKAIELVTSSSDFSLDDIVKQSTAIFLVIDDTNDACNILASIICSQVRNYLVLTADQNGGSLERTWYFLLDEFANMPKLDNYGKFTSTDRGRNVFYCAIVQSLSQLKKTYSEEEKTEILNNADFQLFLGSNEVDSLKYIQALFGTYTLYSRNANISTQNLQNGEYNGSLNLTQRNLVNIDELQYMSIGQAYLYVAKLPPCKSKLIPFYDKELRNNKTFMVGCIDITRLNEYPSFNKTFYDLEERRRIYLTSDPEEFEEETPTEEVKTSTDGISKTKKIIETTDDDLDDYQQDVNKLSVEDIEKLLGWTTNEQEKHKEGKKKELETNEKITTPEPLLKVENQVNDADVATNLTLKLLKQKKNSRQRKGSDEDEE